MVFSAPFQSIRLPPPPGFIPPPVPPRPTVISVLNPFPAVTKPIPKYKINTNNNNLPETTTTKSILRDPSCYSLKTVSDRVVSFDLESSAIFTNTTMTKPIINHVQGSLAPKCSNPSMPNLHYGCEKISQKKSKNPFLTGFLTDITDNDSEHESTVCLTDIGTNGSQICSNIDGTYGSESDEDDDFDDFESAENTDLVLSNTTNHNNKTVKLGENFFASLFNNTTSFTNKIPDPWPATKSTEATAVASANSTAWPTRTTASGTPAAGQPAPGPHGLSPMTPANPSATQKSPTGSQSRPAESTVTSVSVADRYSALKELDEIFKTTVVVSDGECVFL